MLRTIFYAKLAFNAAVFAVFGYHSLVDIQVGTMRARAFQISGNYPDDVLGTFIRAGPAARASPGVNMGQPVFANLDRAKFANLRAVAKTLAAP